MKKQSFFNTWLTSAFLVLGAFGSLSGLYYYEFYRSGLSPDKAMGKQITYRSRYIKSMHNRHLRNYKKFVRREFDLEPHEAKELRHIHAEFTRYYTRYIESLKDSREHFEDAKSQKQKEKILARMQKRANSTFHLFEDLTEDEEDILS